MVLRIKELAGFSLPTAAILLAIFTISASTVYITKLIDALNNFEKINPYGNVFKSSRKMISLTIFVLSLIQLSGVILWVGAAKKIRQMLLPWMFVLFLGIIGGVVGIFIGSYYTLESWGAIYTILYFGVTCGVLSMTCIGVYILIGMYSLYQDIQEERQASPTQVDSEIL